MLIGSGALLLEKVLTPLFSMFLDDSSAKTDSYNKISFRNFRFVENKKKLSVHDSFGEEIFQIDNEV